MAWKTIRLELGQTPDFPNKPPAHAYVPPLPLNATGLIDPAQGYHPGQQPVVRRFSPHELDCEGVVSRKRRGAAFCHASGDADDEALFDLKSHPVRVKQYLTITEADGTQLPFKMVHCHD